MENPSTWGQGKWSDAIALFPWKDFHISETSSFTLHFALIVNDDDDEDGFNDGDDEDDDYHYLAWIGNIIFRLNFALLVTESHYSHPRHLTLSSWKSKQHDFWNPPREKIDCESLGEYFKT